jgi:hypothetical protein
MVDDLRFCEFVGKMLSDLGDVASIAMVRMGEYHWFI